MKKVNEFEYEINTIYLIIIHNFYATVYNQCFEFLLFYEFISTIELG